MALASPPSTSASSASSNLNPPPPSTTFNIASHYNALTKRDPTLPEALAAIDSLIALLSENPLTTIAETLALLSHQTTVLLSSQRNPIPLSAGADLFQRYIISSFQARPSFLQNADFSALRKHLISNSRVFISRAKTASSKIAQHALPFIKDESTIFTYNSSSPAIEAIVSATAESSRYVSIAHITSPTCSISSQPANYFTPQPTSTSTPSSQFTETTTLPLHEVAYALSTLQTSSRGTRQTPIFIVSASAVLENGSIISALGTHQLAILAHAYRIPFYIAVESFKFVRSFPLGTGADDLRRMGVRQDTLVFGDETDGGSKNGAAGRDKGQAITREEEKIDITPPELITALVTENGMMTPQAVAEELIKLWF